MRKAHRVQVVNPSQQLFEVVAAEPLGERPIFLKVMVHFSAANQLLHDVGHLLRLTILFVVSRAFFVIEVAHEVWMVELLKSADLSLHVLAELVSVEDSRFIYDFDGKLIALFVDGELDFGAVAHAKTLF